MLSKERRNISSYKQWLLGLQNQIIYLLGSSKRKESLKRQRKKKQEQPWVTTLTSEFPKDWKWIFLFPPLFLSSCFWQPSVYTHTHRVSFSFLTWRRITNLCFPWTPGNPTVHNVLVLHCKDLGPLGPGPQSKEKVEAALPFSGATRKTAWLELWLLVEGKYSPRRNCNHKLALTQVSAHIPITKMNLKNLPSMNLL